MKAGRGVICLGLAALIFATQPFAGAQQKPPEIRRAQPVDEPPTPKAVPFDTPAPTVKPRRSPPEPAVEPRSTGDEPETPGAEPEAPERRQLDYANALF